MEKVLNQALQLSLPVRLLLIEQLVKSVQLEITPATELKIKREIIEEVWQLCTA